MEIYMISVTVTLKKEYATRFGTEDLTQEKNLHRKRNQFKIKSVRGQKSN